MNADATLRLLGSRHNYEAAGRALIIVGAGAPSDTADVGWLYVNTSTTSDVNILYVWDVTAGSWSACDTMVA
jgi:hypothetical protein